MPLRPPARLAVRAGLAGVALCAGLVGCSSASAPAASGSSTTTVSPSATASVQDITITYRGGTISPPPDKVVVPLGTHVHLTVTSDMADEVHNHLTDEEKEVSSGGTVTFDFVADQPGVYEVELHHADKVLTQLQVQ